jgi:hypothetical protein
MGPSVINLIIIIEYNDDEQLLPKSRRRVNSSYSFDVFDISSLALTICPCTSANTQ